MTEIYLPAAISMLMPMTRSSYVPPFFPHHVRYLTAGISVSVFSPSNQTAVLDRVSGATLLMSHDLRIHKPRLQQPPSGSSRVRPAPSCFDWYVPVKPPALVETESRWPGPAAGLGAAFRRGVE
jgi:hypothetical protein